jgi:hypothetical protein
VIRTPLKTGAQLKFPRKVGRSFSLTIVCTLYLIISYIAIT